MPEHVVDRHAQLTRLFPIELNRDLGSRRVERREQVRQLGPLARLGEERLSLPAQILHCQRAAAVLQQEIEAARGAEAGDRRRHERERHRAGKLRQGRAHGALNAPHVQRFALALIPRLEPAEERTELRAEAVGEHAQPADGVARINAFGLRQNVLDLPEHAVGTLQRRAERQLDVDHEDALILVRHEAAGEHARQGSRQQRRDADHPERQDRAPHEYARDQFT